jgi:hypothetical protein
MNPSLRVDTLLISKSRPASGEVLEADDLSANSGVKSVVNMTSN